MMIDTATPSVNGKGVSVVFNRRLVDPSDADVVMNNISVMSVNGLVAGVATLDYESPGLLHVPASKVYGNPLVEPLNQGYSASTLVPTSVPPGATPCAIPPAAPTAACPIVDVNLTSATKVYVDVPGYISVPQGDVSINTAPGMGTDKKLSFGGGILTGTIGVSADKPVSLQLGLLNSVVQKTFKIVSQTVGANPRVTATALIKVNQTGGYAINSWVTSFG